MVEREDEEMTGYEDGLYGSDSYDREVRVLRRWDARRRARLSRHASWWPSDWNEVAALGAIGVLAVWAVIIVVITLIGAWITLSG